MASERTYIMAKPDGVARGLVGEILKRFENKGFKLVGIKMLQASEELLSKHYEEHIGKPFFPKIVRYMMSGPVVGMVFQGKGVVAYGRRMLGKTNPLESEPGTIRGDFGIESGRNVVHGSDSVASAEREIALWFPEGVVEYVRAVDSVIYEWLDGTPNPSETEKSSENKIDEKPSEDSTPKVEPAVKEDGKVKLSKKKQTSPSITCCLFPLCKKSSSKQWKY